MSHHIIEPEVAGGWGENMLADRSVHPPRVIRLHYRFEGWLGDAILESFPCFIITEEARHKLGAMGATGARLADVEISVSEEFEELYPNRQLPRFVWLQVQGKPGSDDFGILPAPDFRLVISDKVLDALRQFGVAHAIIHPFQPSSS